MATEKDFVVKNGLRVNGNTVITGETTFSSNIDVVSISANTISANTIDRDPTISVTLTGDVTGSGSATLTNLANGSISIATTSSSDSIALGTDTTGNYVSTIAGTTDQIEVTGSGSETAAVTIGLPTNVTVDGLFTSANISVTHFDSTNATIDDLSVTSNVDISGVLSTNKITVAANSEFDSGIFIGADEDILLSESPTNALNLRVGTTGAYKNFSFEADGDLSAPGAITATGNLTANNLTLTSDDDLTFTQTLGDWSIRNAQQGNKVVIYDGTSGVQLVYGDSGTALAVVSGGATIDGNYILTTADEGSGNGIDADTVDGKHSTDFTLDWVTGNNANTTNAIEIGALTATDATLTGDVQVDGDLTVSGNTVTVSATELAIDDNMIYLNANSAVTNPDLGFAGSYNDGTYAHAGLFRDASDGWFKFFDSYTPEPDASIYIDTTHATFALADLEVAKIKTSETSDFDGQVNLNSTVRFNPAGYNFEIDSDTNQRVVFAFNQGGTRYWSQQLEAGNHINFARDTGSGEFRVQGSRVLTTADEGTGNNLDADTVDGFQASQFLRSDASDTTSGALTVQGGVTISQLEPKLVLSDTNNSYGGGGKHAIEFNTTGGVQGFIGVPSDSNNAIFINNSNSSANAFSTLTNSAGGGIYLETDDDGYLNNSKIVTESKINTFSANNTFNNSTHFNNHIYFDTNGYAIYLDSDGNRGSFAWTRNGTLHWDTIHDANGNIDFQNQNTTRGIKITGSGAASTLFDVNDKILLRGDGVISWGASGDQGRLTYGTGQARVRGLSGQSLALGANNIDGYIVIGTDGTTDIVGKIRAANSGGDEKIVLRGTTDPHIMFQENTTDKMQLKWNSDGKGQWINLESGRMEVTGGTARTDPATIAIKSATASTSSPGDIYSQLAFEVQGASATGDPGMSNLSNYTIAAITAQDFRSGSGKTNEDSGIGFYTTGALDSYTLKYRGGISNEGRWRITPDATVDGSVLTDGREAEALYVSSTRSSDSVPLVWFSAGYSSDGSYTGDGSILKISTTRGDGHDDGYLLQASNYDGIAFKIRGDRRTILNPGNTDYLGNQAGVVYKSLQIHDDYDAAGTHWAAHANLDGNHIDGTSGIDSQHGWIFGHSNAVRGGLIYDHRGTERMAMWSSYGPIDFMSPDAADGDGVPIDSNINERMRIEVGGDITFYGLDGGTGNNGKLQRISSAYFVNNEDANISTTLSESGAGARLYFDHNFYNNQASYQAVFSGDGGGFAYYGGDQLEWTAIYDTENTQYAKGTWRQLAVKDYIEHVGNTNTKIQFNTDEIVLYAGQTSQKRFAITSSDVFIDNTQLEFGPGMTVGASVYTGTEAGVDTVRNWLSFDRTNNASHPMLTNRVPNGDFKFASGTAAGGGENIRMVLHGGDGSQQLELLNDTRLYISGATTNANGSLYVRNTAGTGNTIARFVGSGDTLDIVEVSSGDIAIRNSQQNNGITIFDGSSGVDINYNNSAVATFATDITFDVNVEITAGSDDTGGGTATGNAAMTLTNGYLLIPHDEALIVFDEGQKMITSNDSQGNFHIKAGSDDDAVHVDSASGTSGLVDICMDTDGTAGEINLSVGPRRSAGSSALLTAGLRIEEGTSGLNWTTGSTTAGSGLASIYKVWHAGNDGPSSGLDADTVDGIQGANFFRSDTGDTYSGGHGAVYFESNSLDNQSGAGFTIRTSSNPGSGSANSAGAIFAVRSSGQGLRLHVGQSLTSTGDNDFETLDCTATAFYYASDERLKENIATIETATEVIKQLRGVTYDWIESGEHGVGLIAQEVEAIIPEVVSTYHGQDTKTVNYGHLVGYLVEGFKDQQNTIDAQQKQIDELREMIEQLKICQCE